MTYNNISTMIIILYGCTRKEGALVRQFNDITVLGTLQHS